MKKIFSLSILCLLLANLCNAQCTGTPDQPIIKVKHVGTNYVLYAASSTAGLKCSWDKAICSSFLSPATPAGVGDSIIVPESEPGYAYWLSVYCVSSGFSNVSCFICVPFTKDKATVPSLVRKCPGDTLTINASLYLTRFCKQIQWQDSSGAFIPGATSKTLKVIAPATANAYRVISFWPDDSVTYSEWVYYRPYYCPAYDRWPSSPPGSIEEEPTETSISEVVPLNQLYTIYPNPSADGLINITQKVADAKPVDVTIYNIQGSVIYRASRQFNSNSLSLYLDDIPAGLYLLQVTNEKGNGQRLRFVIQK